MQDHQIGMAWLFTKLAAITAITTLIGSGESAKAFYAGRVPKEIAPPYLTVNRVSAVVAQAIGSPPSSTTIMVDVALWGLGNDDTPLTAAMDAMSDALDNVDAELSNGKNISCAVVAPLPPEPPPQSPGDPEVVKLGSTYEIFIGDT